MTPSGLGSLGSNLPLPAVFVKRPQKDRARVVAALDSLVKSFPELKAKKLEGRKEEWRFRVGQWRVIFTPY